MSGMDEMLTWLTGVLDETEAVAVAASRSDVTEWRAGSPGTGAAVEGDGPTPVVYDEGRPNEEEAAHIARHDPRSVLARVEAERMVLDVHWPVSLRAGEGCVSCGAGASEADGGDALPCRTVRALAYGHRHDAPGYRNEWAPEGTPG